MIRDTTPLAAVNARGRHGVWRYAVARKVGEIEEIVKAAAGGN